MYQYCLFDLDGTLTDPREGITKCVQYALHHYGIEEPDLTKLEAFIGPPLADSFMQFYGFPEQKAWEACTVYRERFIPIGAYENKVFEGVPEMLQQMKEKGIQIEYYFHIHREICWKDIDIIERRTMSTDSREGEKASECDIFFICKKGCTEKEKKKKKRGIIFYTMHRKRIMLIGYSKEREEELRQYWDNEIRDQRK